MQRVRKLVDQSAASDLPVLITGEVGVGKELIAREIHRQSSRAKGPLLEINCASLSEESLVGDFAATEEGVAQGMENAASATIFLNGVGELSATLQEGLLRLLRRSDDAQGGHGAFRVRLIAATHRDLVEALDAGRFSEDLYYRLNLIHIHVPPLRSHLEDVPALLKYFLREHAGSGSDGRGEEIPELIRARMMAYEWPGNVRELENAIRCLIALRDPAYVLEELDARADHERMAHVPHAIVRNHSSAPPMPADGGYSVDLKKIGREASDAAEREAIMNMLAHTMGNKKAAARRLGISYKALLYKIRDFGLIGLVGDSVVPPPGKDDDYMASVD